MFDSSDSERPLILYSCPNCEALLSGLADQTRTCPECGGTSTVPVEATTPQIPQGDQPQSGEQLAGEAAFKSLLVRCPGCGFHNSPGHVCCVKCNRRLRPRLSTPVRFGLFLLAVAGLVVLGVYFASGGFHRDRKPVDTSAPFGEPRPSEGAAKRRPLHIKVIDPDIGDGAVVIMGGTDRGVKVGMRLVIMSSGEPNGVLEIRSVLDEASWGVPRSSIRPIRKGDIVLLPH